MCKWVLTLIALLSTLFLARSKYNAYYKSIDWDSIYPNIEFKVDVKMVIEYQGAIN